jgi:hypothetical protein
VRNPNPLGLELRGYEVARATPSGWIVASHWRPTDFALDEALKACAYLNERYPNDTYAVRAIVSMAPPQPAPEGEEQLENLIDAGTEEHGGEG